MRFERKVIRVSDKASELDLAQCVAEIHLREEADSPQGKCTTTFYSAVSKMTKAGTSSCRLVIV